jgi:hypothetical protein
MSAMSVSLATREDVPRETTTLLTVASPIGSLQVEALDAFSPGRARLEAFVRDGYRARFDARVATLLPHLLGATDRTGTLRAVIGFAPATTDRLFLEQYLDTSIEEGVSRIAGRAIRRDQILEVGNLVTDPTSVAPAFLQAFVVWVASFTSCDWLAFTSTRPLRMLLARLGAELGELAVARPERLTHGAEDWGAYYAHQPRVMAVSISALLRCVEPHRFGQTDIQRCLERGGRSR